MREWMGRIITPGDQFSNMLHSSTVEQSWSNKMFLFRMVFLAGLLVVSGQVREREIIDLREENHLPFSAQTTRSIDVQLSGTFHLIGDQLALERGGDTFQLTIICYRHSSIITEHQTARERVNVIMSLILIPEL